MVRFLYSIRRKIILGYILSITVIIAGAIFSYSNIRMIENKIMVSNIVSELFETVLEIRRFEKNLFLYNEENDYLEILRFVDKAKVLITSNRERFHGFVSLSSISDLEKSLKEYRGLVVDNKAVLQTDKNLEQSVRKKGKELVVIAENITNVERTRIQVLISHIQYFIIAVTIGLLIICVVFGYVLLRIVTQPLKLLGETMERISSGSMEKVLINSSDREIVSLSETFNKMLRELELRQTRFIAQSEKLASLGTMVSGIAHQLNNPLSNISTSCQILLEEIEESDPKDAKEILIQVENEIDRAKNVVRSILEFSRKKEFKREPFALKDLAEDAVRLLRGDIPTGVEVKVNIPEDIWFIADKQRLEEAILNIIKNGIESIPDEGWVSISAEKDPETKIIEVKIQDTGLGIETENLEKIFEPFFTTKKHEKGTGLGLFVSREIIKENDGTLEVESKSGEGTTFTIKLPIKER